MNEFRVDSIDFAFIHGNWLRVQIVPVIALRRTTFSGHTISRAQNVRQRIDHSISLRCVESKAEQAKRMIMCMIVRLGRVAPSATD